VGSYRKTIPCLLLKNFIGNLKNAIVKAPANCCIQAGFIIGAVCHFPFDAGSIGLGESNRRFGQ
jgi:hypothetical protein